MKVYMLESGCYDGRYVVGVFSTPQKAMERWQPKPRSAGQAVMGHEYGPWAGTRWKYAWEFDTESGSWEFDADWEHAASIYEVELDAV